MVKSLQESILLHDFSDFIEAFDFTDSFTIQSQSDYNMILDQISLCVYASGLEVSRHQDWILYCQIICKLQHEQL